MSVGLSFQIDFQDGGHGSHLGFSVGMVLALFDLQVTSMLPTEFQVNWSFGSEEGKNRFSGWPPSWHFGFPTGTILAISLPDASYGVSMHLAFCFTKECKNRFSRWSSDLNDFSFFFFFLIHESPRCFLSSFKSTGRSRLLKQIANAA